MSHVCHNTFIITHSNVFCRYEEDPERRERFYYTMLGGGGSPPESACPEVARLVVQQHFNCPSVWCILPLQVRLGLLVSSVVVVLLARLLVQRFDSVWRILLLQVRFSCYTDAGAGSMVAWEG
jgi:hypothetical protein